MVIGKERTNWYEEHTTACTCHKCTKLASSQRKFEASSQGNKIGRNDKCPCGSLKKYKKCHGL
tara:strand:+ start:284 stop:472 length:189 start_codon:yes stop_codon:yes gene_type:complete